MAALGLFEFLEIGLVVPFAIASVADDELAPPGWSARRATTSPGRSAISARA